MDGSSPEGTPIHITEAPRTRHGSDVIVLQGELTGFAEQQAKTVTLKRASSLSTISDHSQNRSATLQLPVQSPIPRPESAPKTLSLGRRRRSAVVIANQSQGTGRSGSEESLTDSFHRGEFRGSFTLRPRNKQVNPVYSLACSYIVLHSVYKHLWVKSCFVLSQNATQEGAGTSPQPNAESSDER